MLYISLSLFKEMEAAKLGFLTIGAAICTTAFHRHRQNSRLDLPAIGTFSFAMHSHIER
jgi:hypothetical protein